MDKKLTFNERTALKLTNLSGSMQFFWFIVFLYIIWVVYNSVVPKEYRLDGQWFPLLLFISNLIQLMLLPILQVGQNILSRNADLRAENQLTLIETIRDMAKDADERAQNQLTLIETMRDMAKDADERAVNQLHMIDHVEKIMNKIEKLEKIQKSTEKKIMSKLKIKEI